MQNTFEDVNAWKINPQKALTETLGSMLSCFLLTWRICFKPANYSDFLNSPQIPSRSIIYIYIFVAQVADITLYILCNNISTAANLRERPFKTKVSQGVSYVNLNIADSLYR